MVLSRGKGGGKRILDKLKNIGGKVGWNMSKSYCPFFLFFITFFIITSVNFVTLFLDTRSIHFRSLVITLVGCSFHWYFHRSLCWSLFKYLSDFFLFYFWTYIFLIIRVQRDRVIFLKSYYPGREIWWPLLVPLMF